MSATHFFSLVIFVLINVLPTPTGAQLAWSQVDWTELPIKNGRVKGYVYNTTTTGRTVTQYLGLPYAEAPIGSLRFRPPVPKKPWTDTLGASFYWSCFQTKDALFQQTGFLGSSIWINSATLSEDCLALNVYAPQNPDGAVMVWFHTGSFSSGSASVDLYWGRPLAAVENVIVVTVNYRLGPFGFLYLGDGTSAPGNMGLLDQQLALRWVQENIGYFGGDKNRVTIFGQGAGAISASAHLFAPDSLFQRIILQSGTIETRMTYANHNKTQVAEITNKFLSLLNCVTGKENLQATENCLETATAEAIQAASDNLTATFGFDKLEAPFRPISADLNFFKGDVYEKLGRRDMKKQVDVTIGSNADEGSYFSLYSMGNLGFAFNPALPMDDAANQALGITTQQFNAALDKIFQRQIFNYSIPTGAAAYIEKIRSVVKLETSAGSTLYRDAIVTLIGDCFVNRGVFSFLHTLADSVYGNIYAYRFAYRTTINGWWPKWTGVMHADEILYIFGYPLRSEHLFNRTVVDSYTNSELQMTYRMMHMWATFAKKGDPADKSCPNSNFPNYDNTIVWPKYTLHDQDIHYEAVWNGLTMKKEKDLKIISC